jgi:periplasmic divalent cation tolerance protein
MTSARGLALVLVTAPDRRTARALARAALREHLAACVNLVPGIESHYWWRGKLERGKEFLLLIKTTRRRLAALERRIIADHPYDTPEFIVLPLTAGNARYLAWLRASASGGAAGAEGNRRG